MSDAYSNNVSEPDVYVTPEGRLRVLITPKRAEQATVPGYIDMPTTQEPAVNPQPTNALVQRGIVDQLLGVNGPRYQTWPERMVRSAISAPAEAMRAAQAPAPAAISDSDVDPVGVDRVLDMTGLIGSGSIPAAALGRETGVLGAMGGKMVQPEAPVFHSAVEHAVMNAPQDKMSAGQWLGWLKNQPGVKQEELDWVGLPKNAGAVTKAEMLDHVRGHGPEIKEVEKRGYEPSDDFIGEVATNAADQWAEQEAANGRPPSTAEWSDQYREIAENIRRNPEEYGWEPQEGDAGGGTRYAQYQLPGGDNYRELLLTMPTKKNTEFEAALQKQRDEGRSALTAYERNLLEGDKNEQAGNYRSSHWDEPNVLVHMRMNDRSIPDGPEGDPLKSLHLEEVQSDWHQQGRKQGYQKPFAEIKASDLTDGKLVDEQHGKWQFTNKENGNTSYGWGSDEDNARINALMFENSHLKRDAAKAGVPDAPFKTTWPDLALKRAITKAAQEGYDAVSWTPGEQQAARYDLSKQVQQILYDPQTGGLWMREVGRSNAPRKVGDYPKDKLPDVIGKEAAEKIVNQKDTRTVNGMTVLEGDGLKVGGEGMKRFYDKMLVDKANAIAKKFGGKVEYKELPQEVPQYSVHPLQGTPHHAVLEHAVGPEGEDLTRAIANFDTPEAAKAKVEEMRATHKPLRVPVLRLTPKMKDAAMRKGMPLFAHGLPYSFTPVDHDPFKGQK